MNIEKLAKVLGMHIVTVPWQVKYAFWIIAILVLLKLTDVITNGVVFLL